LTFAKQSFLICSFLTPIALSVLISAVLELLFVLHVSALVSAAYVMGLMQVLYILILPLVDIDSSI